MNHLMGTALVTAGMSLWAVTGACAQAAFRIDASIPPGIARELKRHGIAVPAERVRGTLEIRDTARDGIQVRFHEAKRAPAPRREGRTGETGPAAPPALAASPAPAEAGSPPPPAAAARGSWVDVPSEVSVSGGCSPVPTAPGTCPDAPASPDARVASLPAPPPAAPEAPSVPPAPKAPTASGPLGEWLVGDGSARIGIHACGANLCGTVTATKEKGRMGERILRDMEPDGENRWTGTILDPRSGKVYQSTMTLTGGSLRVEGCLMGVLCGGETWTRG